MIVFNMLFAGVIAFGVVYNAARIALSERSRELASLRVLGFTRGEISSILLGELALLTLVGMPLGLLMGAGLAHGHRDADCRRSCIASRSSSDGRTYAFADAS